MYQSNISEVCRNLKCKHLFWQLGWAKQWRVKILNTISVFHLEGSVFVILQGTQGYNLKKKWIPEDHYLKGVCKLPVSPPLTCSEQLTCLAATTQRLSIVHQTACSAAFCRLSFDTHTHTHTHAHAYIINFLIHSMWKTERESEVQLYLQHNFYICTCFPCFLHHSPFSSLSFMQFDDYNIKSENQ